MTTEPAIRMREKITVEERTRIAQKACEFIKPGDVPMLMAQSLKGRHWRPPF